MARPSRKPTGSVIGRPEGSKPPPLNGRAADALKSIKREWYARKKRTVAVRLLSARGQVWQVPDCSMFRSCTHNRLPSYLSSIAPDAAGRHSHDKSVGEKWSALGLGFRRPYESTPSILNRGRPLAVHLVQSAFHHLLLDHRKIRIPGQSFAASTAQTVCQ